MRLERACEAIEKACCLELYYERHSLIVEVHAAGYDPDERQAILCFELLDNARGRTGEWHFIQLEDTRKVAVSGYFSQAPRVDFKRDDPRFGRILAQV